MECTLPVTSRIQICDLVVPWHHRIKITCTAVEGHLAIQELMRDLVRCTAHPGEDAYHKMQDLRLDG